MTTEHVWLGIGLLGQAFFSARFLVQWIASERAQKSVVPRHFWFFSVGGGMTLLAYAIYRLNTALILGQDAGLFDTERNINLLYRRSERLDLDRRIQSLYTDDRYLLVPAFAHPRTIY